MDSEYKLAYGERRSGLQTGIQSIQETFDGSINEQISMNEIMSQALKQHQRKVKDLKKLSLIDKTVQRQGLLFKMNDQQILHTKLVEGVNDYQAVTDRNANNNLNSGVQSQILFSQFAKPQQNNVGSSNAFRNQFSQRNSTTTSNLSRRPVYNLRNTS